MKHFHAVHLKESNMFWTEPNFCVYFWFNWRVFKVSDSAKMPPLKQPKDLSYFCYSTFSIHCAKCLKNIRPETPISDFRDFFSNLPISILENLGSWIVQNAAGLIHCLSGGDQIGKDDQVFLFGTCYLRSLHQCFNVLVW